MRRRVVAGLTYVLGSALLARSLHAEPGSRRFFRDTFATAATWTVGGALSRPGGARRAHGSPLESVAVGAAAFVPFYAGAHLARRIPLLRRALTGVLRHVHDATTPWVVVTTMVNGVAEEIFFRGALYELSGRPGAAIARTSGFYVLTVTGSGNPALILASAAMGPVFAWQRARGGTIVAPALTHLTWSALMLAFVAPLFRRGQAAVTPAGPRS